MAALVGRTVLYTLILVHVLHILRHSMHPGSMWRTVWFVLTPVVLGVRTAFPPGAELRVVAAAFLLFSLGNHLCVLSGKDFPRVWNIAFGGLFVTWAGVYPLGYADLTSHTVFSLLLLCFSLVFAVLKLTAVFRQTRIKAVLFVLAAGLACGAADGWDFAVFRWCGSPGDIGLWVSFLFVASAAYLHLREADLLELPVKAKGGTTGLLSRLEQVETSLYLQNRLSAAGYMATGAAHEFKNILSQIQLCAEYGIAASDRQSKDRSFQAIRDNLETAKTAVVSMLHQFTKTGRERPLPVDLKELLERLRRRLAASYRMESIRFRLEIAGNPKVSARQGELEQVLLNIVRNAVDAYRRGAEGKDREITLIAAGREECTVLEIRDHAGGIPENLQGRLFDPPSPGKPDGLGLFISRSLVSRGGGRLDFIPLDQGSCFRIVYPKFTLDAADSGSAGDL